MRISTPQDFDRLIPREEMRELASTLETTLARVDDKFECEILGSYRRGVGFSSDIDLAVRHKDFTDKDDEATSKPMMTAIVRELEAQGLVQEEQQLMFGPKKYAVSPSSTLPSTPSLTVLSRTYCRDSSSCPPIVTTDGSTSASLPTTRTRTCCSATRATACS